MESKSIVASIFIASFLGLFFPGCDRLPLPDTDPNANFLIGTWILDREKTMEALTHNTVGENVEGLAGKLAAVTVQKSAEKLIQPLDNVRYTFTDSQYSEKVGSYDGQSKSYEIISRPGTNQIKTKDEKGIVNLYHLEGQNVWYLLRGQEKLKIYLRAAN